MDFRPFIRTRRSVPIVCSIGVGFGCLLGLLAAFAPTSDSSEVTDSPSSVQRMPVPEGKTTAATATNVIDLTGSGQNILAVDAGSSYDAPKVVTEVLAEVRFVVYPRRHKKRAKIVVDSTPVVNRVVGVDITQGPKEIHIVASLSGYKTIDTTAVIEQDQTVKLSFQRRKSRSRRSNRPKRRRKPSIDL